MRTTQSGSAKKDHSRKILAGALAMLALGVILLAVSVGLDAKPGLDAVSDRLRLAVPYVLLVGFALLVLYVVVRPLPDRRSGGREEPTLFGKDTTVFASRLEGEAEDDSRRTKR